MALQVIPVGPFSLLFYYKKKEANKVTTYQEMKIKELRFKGVGYKSISLMLDLNRDQVRYYCKKAGLAGTKEELAAKIEEEKKKGETCAYCGEVMIRSKYAPTKKFCQEKCRRDWWKEHPEKRKKSVAASYVKTCEFCKRPFTTYGNKNRKYCSHDCYIKDRFWRDEDGIQEA